ncbi:MAG: FkbM family methyltransferase [Chloroflexi bacterium]|nr:FkbM family methyltransferase [Chloroflexota bacterium]
MARLATRDIDVGCVIDIGASNGAWTRLAVKHFPNARFLAIEALEERRPDLEALKQELPGVDYVIAAASNRHGDTVSLVVSDDLDGSTVGGRIEGNTRSVPTVSVDALVVENDLPGPFVLKLDTHGFELPIIDGAAGTLKNTSAIIIEVYNFPITDSALMFHEMCTKLGSLGFRCADLADPLFRPSDKVLWQMDFVFLPGTHPVFAHATYSGTSL